ncbi:hypothetical protein [Bacillus coahuilensis]|uniref:hypothetical protein n=1 Tax=Bacillus coahuilensis TaxID=408580 RepID=UPI001ED8F309|nr:hypothetical protein [Bacillus coahuilensis]
MMWYCANFVFRIYRKRIGIGILVGMVAVCTLLFSFGLPVVQNTLNRVLDGGNIGGEALAGRIGTSVYFTSLPENMKWIGIGYGSGESSLYMSSFYRFLYECGYFSVLILGILLVSAFRRGSRYIKFFVIILAIMTYFSSPFTAAYLSFFFAFLYAYNNKQKLEFEK